VLTVTTPAPAAGESAQVTTSVYDEAGRVIRTQAPDGLWTTNEYYLTGLYRKTSGARVYPVEYTFDYAGRLATMTTWQDYASSSGAAVTAWAYEGTRGFLTNKVYQGTNGPGYTYTGAGRLATRNWARGLTTVYSYNNAGELQAADYSDSTPDVSYAYDRQGRPAQITGATTNDFAYTAEGTLLSENVVNKSWNYASHTRVGYDAFQRRTGLTNLSLGLTHSYAYDAASRLQSVSTLDSGAASLVSYSYVSNSPLVDGITFQQGGTTRLTTSKSYDNLNRLRQIASVTNAQAVASFAYAYNSANQRTAVTNVDGSRWAFGYDRLGQVTNGWRYWSDGSDVLGQTFNYAFDDIGNRRTVGTGTSASQRTQTYSVNLLNQYTNRTVPGYLEVNGSADSAAAVTVNGASPSRQGEYYRQEVSVNNASTALVQWLTSRATNTTGTSVVARLSFVPQTPEAFVHDPDGNLTQDGLWNYTWDGENRLTRIETRTNAIIDSNYWQRIDCTYDNQSRRIRKQVFTWNPSAIGYQLTTSLRFFYDAWNLVGQVDEVTGTRLSFVWGTDLSGTMQAAGGVGGLDALIVHNGSLAGTYFYGYDGNGNVAALVNAADGTEAARYEYGPFLELLRATGPVAHLNPFRASTKYQDDETDLLYYGYRYLSTVTGRWISRDPIEERGELNLFMFVGNDGTRNVDRDGRERFDIEHERRRRAGPPPPPTGISLWVHYAYGNGKNYVEHDGPWAGFLRNHQSVKNALAREYETKAEELFTSKCKNGLAGASEGKYTIVSHRPVIDDGYFLGSALFRGHVSQSGRYQVLCCYKVVMFFPENTTYWDEMVWKIKGWVPDHWNTYQGSDNFAGIFTSYMGYLNEPFILAPKFKQFLFQVDWTGGEPVTQPVN
jgi:RHS repeat-associated protein